MSKTQVNLKSTDSINCLCDYQQFAFNSFAEREKKGPGKNGTYEPINDIIYDMENLTYETYRALVSELSSIASQPNKFNRTVEITNSLPILANTFPVLQFTREAITNGFIDENQPASQIFADAIKFMKMTKIKKNESVDNIPANIDIQNLEKIISTNFSLTKGFVCDNLQKQAKLQNLIQLMR